MRWTRWFDGETPPQMGEVDMLIVMGGPMSVNDEEIHPWLAAEKAYVREFLQSGKPMLGVCLGAQLMAAALGARVFPNPEKEIGWFPVFGTGEAKGFRFPERLPVFHWHGETFELPPGAVRLASSEGCRNQAFQVGDRAVGLQFHLETTPDTARALVDHCRGEMTPGPYVQAAEEILSAPDERYREVNRVMGELLDWLLR